MPYAGCLHYDLSDPNYKDAPEKTQYAGVLVWPYIYNASGNSLVPYSRSTTKANCGVAPYVKGTEKDGGTRYPGNGFDDITYLGTEDASSFESGLGSVILVYIYPDGKVTEFWY